MSNPPIDFSLGISWQFGLLAVSSLVVFPLLRARYAFFAGALAYSMIDILPALFGAQGTIGLWTLTGAFSWGIVAALFACEKNDGSPFTFAKLGLGGTLIFDALTGPLASTFIWGMPFSDALVGQVPFTLKHLLGIGALSLIGAPLLFPSVRAGAAKLDFIFLKEKRATAWQ